MKYDNIIDSILDDNCLDPIFLEDEKGNKYPDAKIINSFFKYIPVKINNFLNDFLGKVTALFFYY